MRGKRDHTPEEIAAFAAEGRAPVWRFAVPLPGETVIEDMVRGTVTFGHDNIEDFVVARSDGTPTYNLAAAVDDVEMGITHVLRGEDHVSNTPKQMLVMRALGAEPPRYAHIPLILGPDKKRLSKRHGAASVEDFEADGFLPEPLVNSLALLGWSYDDKTERFTMDELVQAFSVGRISKSPAVFDQRKTEVMHGRYLRMMDPQAFEDALVQYLGNTGFIAAHGGADAEALVRRSAKAVKGKLTKLSEYGTLAGWLFEPLTFEPEAWEKLTADVKHSIQVIGGGLGRLEGLRGVGASGHQGRPAGPAARPRRERPGLPRAAAHRRHRPRRLDRRLREHRAHRPRRGHRPLPHHPRPPGRDVGGVGDRWPPTT